MAAPNMNGCLNLTDAHQSSPASWSPWSNRHSAYCCMIILCYLNETLILKYITLKHEE